MPLHISTTLTTSSAPWTTNTHPARYPEVPTLRYPEVATARTRARLSCHSGGRTHLVQTAGEWHRGSMQCPCLRTARRGDRRRRTHLPAGWSWDEHGGRGVAGARNSPVIHTLCIICLHMQSLTGHKIISFGKKDVWDSFPKRLLKKGTCRYSSILWGYKLHAQEKVSFRAPGPHPRRVRWRTASLQPYAGINPMLF